MRQMLVQIDKVLTKRHAAQPFHDAKDEALFRLNIREMDDVGVIEPGKMAHGGQKGVPSVRVGLVRVIFEEEFQHTGDGKSEILATVNGCFLVGGEKLVQSISV